MSPVYLGKKKRNSQNPIFLLNKVMFWSVLRFKNNSNFASTKRKVRKKKIKNRIKLNGDESKSLTFLRLEGEKLNTKTQQQEHFRT